MALPFFYEPDIAPGTDVFTLGEETSQHCVKVLRMQPGEELHLTDGKGHLLTAAIVTADKKATVVKIASHTFTEQPERRVTIAISLLKNAGRFEWFLEKATEIGVSAIIPLLCSRTERQHFRHQRMQNVLIAAMLQSQQTWLPQLHEPVTMQEALTNGGQQLIAHCLPDQKQSITHLPLQQEVTMFIGPEGDFTPAEIELALSHHCIPVSLGATRLRTETAGVVAAALLMNH